MEGQGPFAVRGDAGDLDGGVGSQVLDGLLPLRHRPFSSIPPRRLLACWIIRLFRVIFIVLIINVSISFLGLSCSGRS